MITEETDILIVDDEKELCDILYNELSYNGFQCTTVQDGETALAELMTQNYKVVLLDLRLPGLSGMEILEEIKSNLPDVATIIITAVNDVSIAVQAMQFGALDYIVKPFNLDRIVANIHRALEKETLIIKDQDNDKDEKLLPAESLELIDDIAYGVEARLDPLMGYSKSVIRETVHIARGLDIPTDDIQLWVDKKLYTNHVRINLIKFSLDKLLRSPLAQKFLGLLKPLFVSERNNSLN